MRIPISWLNEYVDVSDLSVQELSDKLTFSGVEVEGIETDGPALDDHFVVGEVLTCDPHPDSDHMHVCTVDVGNGEKLGIVCGAPNCRAGLKVAVAKIGAVIPDGGFKIKPAKLRGVPSSGMLCSAKELAISQDHSGIMELDAALVPGTKLVDALPKGETVFDLEITWNRSDCLSVIGIAREFAALLGRPLKLPAVDFAEEDGTDVNALAKVVVETENCPRYTARVLTGVQDGPSPDWMAKRLELCDVRSLGLAVDVTNYVMLELGQPMHAFDHRTLKDRTIVVRDARDGETIKTLDGVERKLDPSMLMICDAERPNAVAGIMGGEDSGIAPGTTSVLLESALFEPTSTKFTASKLGLASESSYRYIRGVDKDLADFASRRAAHLLQKHGAAKIAKGIVDVDNRPQPLNPDVTLDFERARRLIGIPVGNDAMVFLLKGLGFVPRGKDNHFAAATSVAFGGPSWRWDISAEADLVEEIARLYGLDNIPDTMPSAPSISPLSDAPFRAKSRVRELCLALGFTEAMHYSFLSKKELDDFDTRTADRRLVIPDPVSAEYGVMRDSLLPQMMGSLGRNASHQLETAMLFEIGKVFNVAKTPKGDVPCERESLSLGFVGPVGREALRTRAPLSEEESVLWMKGVVDELVAKLHAGKLEFEPADHPAFAKGAALSVKLNGRAIGVLGALSAKMRHPYRLTTQMVLCELDLKPLLKRVDELGRVSPVPQFPLVRRDIALVVAKAVTNAAIEKVIRDNGGKELVKVTLFDVFKDSRAYSLEFRSAERTLTDEEVGRTFQRIVDALKATAGIEVRES